MWAVQAKAMNWISDLSAITVLCDVADKNLRIGSGLEQNPNKCTTHVYPT